MRLLRKKKERREPAPPPPARGEPTPGFLPRRGARRRLESFFMRVIATGGIVGVGTAIGAIMGTQDVDAWIVGIVVSGVSVIFAAILWSSRTL